MKTWVRRSLNVGVLSAGFLLVGGTAAQADMNSGPNTGALSGNQLSSVLQTPIDVCGNAISVGGFADASCEGGASAVNGGGGTESMTTGYNAGALSGNQLSSVIQAPISVCGNAVSVLGFADASCVGGASAVNGGGSDDAADDAGSNYESARAEHSSAGGAAMNAGSGMTTGYNAGLVSGNQVSSVIQAPIDLCGNAIAVLGFASASCDGGASAVNGGGGTESMTSGFNAGIVSGNQVSSVIQAPISVCGNAVSVLGFADASCVGGASAVNGGGSGAGQGSGSGGHGYNNGNNAGYGAGGQAGHGHNHGLKPSGAVKGHNKAKAHKHAGEHSNAGARRHASHNGTGSNSGYGQGNNNGGGAAADVNCGGSGMTTGYNAGLLSGNQFSSVIQIPVDVSGNAFSLLGFASASSTGGASAVNC